MKVKIEFEFTRNTFKAPFSFIKRVVLSDIKRSLKIATILAAFILLKYFLGAENGYIVVSLYFLASVLFAIESRYSFGIALFCLVTVPFLLQFDLETVAENYAVFAYFFLAIGTFLAFVEYIKENRPSKKARV